MTTAEYKAFIDNLNADELVEVVRLARLDGDEKRAFEEIDIYERRLKETAYAMNMDPRQFDRILQRARDKVIKRVFTKRKKSVFLSEIRRS